MSARDVDRRKRAKTSPPGPGRRRPPSPSSEEIVRTGWNARAAIYRPPGTQTDGFGHTDGQYREWLGPLFEDLAPGSRVLDLGCGTGEPASRALATSFDLTGVDISEAMIRRARSAVLSGQFRRADMTEVDFPRSSFSAVISLYAIIHVPLAKQRPLLGRIYRWLRPGGLFLAVLGAGRYEGTVRGWLGVDSPMFWSHTGAATYRRWLCELGFTVLRQEFVPEGDGGHELFLAKKPPSPAPKPRPARARARS